MSLDAVSVGKAIAYLRKKIGYTQRELAERIGVSDKAVSKWERGIGLPDTAIIGKIAILLDSDTDSLLAGDIIHQNTDWTGLLILNENECGINSGTIIYDKPIVYFQLSYFMLVGIRTIRVVCNEEDEQLIRKELDNGEELGIRLYYYRGIPVDKFLDSPENVMIVSGMSLIYGVDQTRFFQKAMLNKERTTILSLPKKRESSFARIYYDSDKKIVTSEDGDKLRTQYDYYQIPIIFCPANMVCTMFKGIENLNSNIIWNIGKEELYTVILDRGFVEIPLNTWNDVMDASLFVKIVQKACGMQIYCIEEIAWRRGFISHDDFIKLGEKKSNVPYGKYILDISRAKDVKLSGIGVDNVRDRIRLHFGENYTTIIQSEIGKGTIVTLHIPKMEGK